MAIDLNDPATRAQYQSLAEGVRAELAKPQAEQDLKFLGHATMVLQKVQAEVGATPADAGGNTPAQLAQQANPAQAPGPEDPAARAWDIVTTQLQALGQSAGNRAMEIGDYVTQGLRTPEQEAATADARRVANAQGQLDVDKRVLAQGRDPNDLSVRALRGAGSLVPDVAIGALPGGIVGRGMAAAGGRVGSEMLIGGGLEAAAQYGDGGAGQRGGFALGALGSGVLGSIAEIPNLGRNIILRDLATARRSEAFARGGAIEDTTGIRTTIGEKTGDPVVGQAEAAVRGRSGDPREKFLLQREDDVNRFFSRSMDRLNPQRTSPEDIVSQGAAAFDTHIKGLQDAASERFRLNLLTGMDPVKGVGGHLDHERRIIGGERWLDPTNIISELYAQANQLQQAQLVTNKSAKLKTIFRTIDDLEEQQALGGLRMGQAQRLAHDLSDASRGSGNRLKDVNEALDITDPGALARALDRDMQAAQAKGGRAAVAADALDNARTQYGLDKDRIKAYEGSGLAALVGKLQGKSPEEFGTKLLALPPGQFSELLAIADRADPGLANKMRALVFDEMIQKHRFADKRLARVGSDTPRLDYVGFINEFDKMPYDKLEAFIGQGVDAETAVQMRAGIQSLRQVAEGTLAGGGTSPGKSFVDRMSQFAINAASRDKGFIARLVTGEFTPGIIERLLFTSEGRESLITFGRSRASAAQFSQAAGYVVRALEQDDANKERLAEARRKAEYGEPALPRGSVD